MNISLPIILKKCVHACMVINKKEMKEQRNGEVELVSGARLRFFYFVFIELDDCRWKTLQTFRYSPPNESGSKSLVPSST